MFVNPEPSPVIDPDVTFIPLPDTSKLPVITASPTNGNASALGA